MNRRRASLHAASLTRGASLAAATLVAVLTACAAFAAVGVPAARDSALRGASAAEIEARLRAYSRFVGRMEQDSVAAMFTADGEVAHAGGRAIRGRDSILVFLNSFRGFSVDSNRTMPDSIHVAGGRATQFGTFWQRVTLPDGRTVEASGLFEVRWVRERDGVWRIRRMATRPRPH